MAGKGKWSQKKTGFLPNNRKAGQVLKGGKDKTAEQLSHSDCLTPYPEEEAEFLKAISKFRSVHGRAPSLREGFRIAIQLGWRKT